MLALRVIDIQILCLKYIVIDFAAPNSMLKYTFMTKAKSEGLNDPQTVDILS